MNIITMLPRFILLRNGTKTPIGTADTREEAEEKAKARIPYNGSFKPIGIYELVAIGEVGREIVVSPYQGEG